MIFQANFATIEIHLRLPSRIPTTECLRLPKGMLARIEIPQGFLSDTLSALRFIWDFQEFHYGLYIEKTFKQFFNELVFLMDALLIPLWDDSH